MQMPIGFQQYRQLCVEAFRAGHIDVYEFCKRMWNAGFRGSYLNPRA